MTPEEVQEKLKPSLVGLGILLIILTALVAIVTSVAGIVKTNNEVTIQHQPMFHFGESVYVTTGFYKGCKGTVWDYNTGFNPIHYKLDAKCSLKDGSSKSVSIEVDENWLVEDAT